MKRGLVGALLVVGPLGAALCGFSCSPGVHDGVEVSGGECVSCHKQEYLSASEPRHEGVLSTRCSSCHGNEVWSPAEKFKHEDFDLEGAHTKAQCNECHEHGFDDTPSACVACHRDDYDAALMPSHAGFPTDCKACHDVAAWRSGPFEHEWPLLGKHGTAPCFSCHTGTRPYFESTPTRCNDCHADDRAGADNPVHDELPTDCGSCHTPTGWQPAKFDHAEWPLTGAHGGVTCNACHDGKYDDTPNRCVDCHERGEAPSHAKFSSLCSDCHNTKAWRPAKFDHTASWPLTGKHLVVTCAQCHGTPLVYTGTPTQCADCHKLPASPDHGAFPSDCTSCHTTSGWPYTHPANALQTGGHAMTACTKCHTGAPAVWTGISTICVDCHLDDYNSSPYVGHSAFAKTCADCHSMKTWQGATGGHPESKFPIKSGNHSKVACTTCHNVANGSDPKTNAGCDQCHTGVDHRRSAMDPVHINDHHVPGYPTGPAPHDFCANAGCHPAGSN